VYKRRAGRGDRSGCHSEVKKVQEKSADSYLPLVTRDWYDFGSLYDDIGLGKEPG